ncbi:MazG family protein [Curtobacterium sp. RRHDQ10]|uniref:MazG family protein n=1 Tax=Curtobacterium phyllosphaerae TaxID=3413379 RepID=UPI003BF25DCF
MTAAQSSSAVLALVDVVDQLLDPGGCVWNRAQTHASLATYAVEESYELVDAIDADDPADILEELGDVLYQVVLHAGIAERSGAFDLGDVAEHVRAKMVHRHPHVFGDERADTFEEVVRVWRAAKASEKASRTSAFDGVPHAMPPLERAVKLLERAEEHGLGAGPLDRVTSELAGAAVRPGVTGGADGRGAVDPGWGAAELARIAAARAAGIDPVASLRAAVAVYEEQARASERS